MRELAALQARFGAGLEVAGSKTVALDIFNGESEQVASRFGIYRGNARANAARALAATYPVIGKIVGGEFFSGLAHEYESRFPSVSGDLNTYGESFAAFLAVFAPAQDIPYLADVAQLEWRVHHAHYAADANPFEPARLRLVPAEKQLHLIPKLHPACSLLHSEFPLARSGRSTRTPITANSKSISRAVPPAYLSTGRGSGSRSGRSLMPNLLSLQPHRSAKRSKSH